MTISRDLTAQFFKLRPKATKYLECKFIVDPVYDKAMTILDARFESVTKLVTGLEFLERIIIEKRKSIFDEEKTTKLLDQQKKFIALIKDGLVITQSNLEELKDCEHMAKYADSRQIIHNRVLLLKNRVADFLKKYKEYEAENKKRFPEENLFGTRTPQEAKQFPVNEVKEPQQLVQSDKYQQLLELDTISKQEDERNQRILHLATQTTELANLFKSLDTLIEGQGEILERVDVNIARALEDAKRGVLEIEKAKKIQDKSSTGKTILGLSAVIAVLSGALILKKAKIS